MNAELALRNAIRTAALADATVAALVNGSFFDGATRDAVFPYVAFGDVLLRDWSTGSDAGLEHMFSLDIWSMQPGTAETLKLADAILDFAGRTAFQLQGAQLIDLRFLSFEARRESNGRLARGRLRFRAITEQKAGG